MSRAATALLGALLLPTLPALPIVPVGPVHAAAPSRADDPGRYADRVSAASDAAARAYREATRASRAYDRSRRAADRQRKTVGQLRVRLGQKRRAYTELREDVGQLAAKQYRAGGAGALVPGARLALSNSPEEFLARTSTMARGNRAAARMVTTAEQARDEVARSTDAAHQALERLRRDEARKKRLKRQIEVKLSQAEERLRALLPRATTGGGCETSGNSASGNSASKASEKLSGSAPQGASWVAPVKSYRLSAGYGASGGRWARGHTGQDFAVANGTPVRAVGPGTVTAASCDDAYGQQLLIRHDDGYYTQYAHLSRFQARPGQRVGTGQQIALSGTTGNSSGPHLHFEVRVTPRYGSGINPVPWLRERGVRL